MKKIKRRTRNKIISILSIIFVLTLGILLVKSVNKAGNDVQKTLLGKEAYEYGIVTNKFQQWYHLDTNFATKEYEYVNGGFDFRVSAYTDGMPGETIATLVKDEIKATSGVNETKALIKTGMNPKAPENAKIFHYDKDSDQFYGGTMDVVQEDKDILNNKIDNMISHVRNQSLFLAKKLSEKDVDYKITKNYMGNSPLITILTDEPNIYINASDFIQWDNKYDGSLNGGIDIYDTDEVYVKRKNNKQTIIFNYAIYEEKEEIEKTDKPTSTPKEKEEIEETPKVEETEVPKIEEEVTPEPTPEIIDEEETEETPVPTIFEEETTASLFDEKIAKAAEKSAKIDVEASQDLRLQIHTVRFVGEGTPDQAPVSKEDIKKTLNVCESIIFNIPYGKQIWFDEVFGTIAACNSDVKFGGSNGWTMNHGTCIGWLVAKTIFTNCGEWHYVREKVENTSSPVPTPTPTKIVDTFTPIPTPTEIVETSTPLPTPTEEVEIPTSTPIIEIPTSTPIVTVETSSPTPIITINTSTPIPTSVIIPTSAVVIITPSPTPLIITEEDVPKTYMTPEPIIEVPDEDTPLSSHKTPKPKNNTTTITEDKVPLASTTPDTGDEINPFLLIALMGISLITVIGIIILSKKEKK